LRDLEAASALVEHVDDSSPGSLGDRFGATAGTQFRKQRRQVDPKFSWRNAKALADLADRFPLRDQLKCVPLPRRDLEQSISLDGSIHLDNSHISSTNVERFADSPHERFVHRKNVGSHI